jgi:hypothetical protein
MGRPLHSGARRGSRLGGELGADDAASVALLLFRTCRTCLVSPRWCSKAAVYGRLASWAPEPSCSSVLDQSKPTLKDPVMANGDAVIGTNRTTVVNADRKGERAPVENGSTLSLKLLGDLSLVHRLAA